VSDKTIRVFCGSKTEKDFETFGWVAYQGQEKLNSGSGVVYSMPGAGDYNAVMAALGWLLTSGYAGATTTIYIGNYQSVVQLNLHKLIPPVLHTYHKQVMILSGKFRNVSFKWIPREENLEALALSQSAFENMNKTYSLCREGKAQMLSVKAAGSKFKVESQNKPGVFYTVDLISNTCDCPDYLRRGKSRMCKHIIAARNTARKAV